MKNINIKKIELSSNEIESFVQLKIMQGEQSKVMASLENPNTISEAVAYIESFVNESEKYADYIGNNKDLIIKALYVAFLYNKPIKEALDYLLRKNTSIIAATKLDALLKVGEFANNSYKPVNNKDFFVKKIA